MLIAVCSLKGSPGVTTWSVALAARWPHAQRCVVVEADPSGGSLGARFRLAPTPGLASLTAAARRDRAPHLLWSHTQPLPGGLLAVVAPPGADYARSALHTLLGSRHQTVSALRGAATPETVVIVDCGRLDSDSPAMAIAREADRVLLLARAGADDLTHVAAGLSTVGLWSLRPGLLLVGPGYPDAEVTRELGIPVLARIPQDDRGARALTGAPGPRRGPTGSRLGRAAHAVATSLSSPVAGLAGGAVGCAVPLERSGSPVTTLWRHPLVSGTDQHPTNDNRLEDQR